ncbi:MAG: thioredoxin-disulfide reductase [Alphaproteobacteria bacterium]|nr:thioredoxin-disulfide reductase [Alphaproteobacteria bacterium]MBR1756666.1 thioredoxin-disulfide reductase [Alphaproteobacteria bacterium]
MAEYKSDLLIIGSGPAGYTAGIYAARAGIKSLIVAGAQKGGQLIRSSEVENFPGFTEVLSGYDLMNRIHQQAMNLGVHLIDDEITEVDFYDHPFVCSSASGNSFISKSIIIATGASVNWLGLPSEQKYIGHGVSSCATCDGFFYKGKEVAVIGGGNSALEQALYLTNYVEKVYLIHRRHSFNAEHALQKRLFENRKVTIFWNNVVDEIIGTDEPLEVTGLRIRNVKSDKKKFLDVAGVFVAIGHHPNTELFRRYLQLDSSGYIVTKPKSNATDIKGVYAAGDVCNPYRQAIIAAGCGARAALEAIQALS